MKKIYSFLFQMSVALFFYGALYSMNGSEDEASDSSTRAPSRLSMSGCCAYCVAIKEVDVETISRMIADKVNPVRHEQKLSEIALDAYLQARSQGENRSYLAGRLGIMRALLEAQY